MSSFSKFSNPYLPIGELHNAGLNYVVAGLPAEPTIEDVNRLVSEYLQTVTSETTRIMFSLYYQLVSIVINENISVPFGEVLKKAEINPVAISFIENILSIEETLSYEQILRRIKNVETSIALSELSQADKAYPFLFVAVAKASVTYWVRQIADPESPWIPFLPEGETMETFKWPWKEDAEGAIAGAIGGAIGGAITGPGVGISALAGAIGGAVGASVASAIVGLL